jgi:4-oxalocrotonate tautomerase
MPLAKVSLLKGKTKEYKQAVHDGLYDALRNFGMGENALCMLINEYEKENFMFPKNYHGVEHTDDIIMIEITANNTRTQDQKKALYADIVSMIVEKTNVRKEDILINIIEVLKDNWSMGNGVAAFV